MFWRRAGDEARATLSAKRALRLQWRDFKPESGRFSFRTPSSRETPRICCPGLTPCPGLTRFLATACPPSRAAACPEDPYQPAGRLTATVQLLAGPEVS